jgi:hypothetical protein
VSEKDHVVVGRRYRLFHPVERKAAQAVVPEIAFDIVEKEPHDGISQMQMLVEEGGQSIQRREVTAFKRVPFGL